VRTLIVTVALALIAAKQKTITYKNELIILFIIIYFALNNI